MAVSKTLRFQVLRRDGFKCKYCGVIAGEAELTVDHVVPVALGGRDEASNLVTACRPCNSGKSATPPDASLVATVSDDALRWAEAQKRAAASLAADFQQVVAKRERFLAEWNGWTWDMGQQTFPLPPGWEDSVDRLLQTGLPMELLIECMGVAMRNSVVKVGNKFRYMCGVAWNKVRDLQQVTARLVGAPVDTPKAVDYSAHVEALYELTLREIEHYGAVAKGVIERLRLDSFNEDALAGAIAEAEIEEFGRRIDLIKDYLDNYIDDGQRFHAQALQEWHAVDPTMTADSPEVWEVAADLAVKDEALGQAAWSYFYELSANQKDSWFSYYRKAFPDQQLEAGPLRSAVSRVAYEFSQGLPLPTGMCVVVESNAIEVCFNRAGFLAAFTECPICPGTCTGDHAVCEHHVEIFMAGMRLRNGKVLSVSDFKVLGDQQ